MNSGSDKHDDVKTLTEQLEHELGFHAGTGIGLEILWCLDRLIKDEDEDLNWIDLMVLTLTREGVPLPTTIQVLAARAAERRLLGFGKRKGKPSKVMKEYTKRLAHSSAAFLQGALDVGSEISYDIAVNSVAAQTGFAGMASSVSRGRKKYEKDVGGRRSVDCNWEHLGERKPRPIDSAEAASCCGATARCRHSQRPSG